MTSLTIQAEGLTDTGMVRHNNEDAFYISPARDFLLVADGMGGHAGGEVASATIVEVVAAATREPFSRPDAGQALSDLLHEADLAVRARAVGELTNMGSTVVAMHIREDHYWIAHAGDSRAYLLRDQELNQLTVDHSPLYDMPGFNGIGLRTGMITRAIGVGEETRFDLTEGDLVPGDRFLLCSDGLTDAISSDRIHDILVDSPETGMSVRSLIEAAIAAGGPDNITAVVADMRRAATSPAGNP